VAEGTMAELQARASSGAADNSLENIFLSLTGTSDVRAIVEELSAR